VVACGLDDTHIYDMFFCYLLTGVLAGLVVACVLDDIHIYDMFFCYLLTDALAGLVVARAPVNKQQKT
jgi:sugar phosphate permease